MAIQVVSILSFLVAPSSETTSAVLDALNGECKDIRRQRGNI